MYHWTVLRNFEIHDQLKVGNMLDGERGETRYSLSHCHAEEEDNSWWLVRPT